MVAGDGVTLSGLMMLPTGVPRMLVVALHGGGLRASYFQGGVEGDASLLGLGAQIGYAVLALDRPGYGASTESLPDGLPLIEQAKVTVAAIERFRSEHGVSAPLFLVGHSMGAKLALHIAAHAAPGDLVGLECSGIGLRYNPGLRSYPGRDADSRVDLTTDERMALFWGPAELYPSGALERQHRPTAAVPRAEAQDAVIWPRVLREIAPKVRVPLRYTVADHEQWWDVRPATLQEFVSLFRCSPGVQVAHQAKAGHNISLGRSARAYHLGVAAFAEACLLEQSARCRS
jgi:pimeloyl-ACP methyl ester carboxylesterase